MGDELFVFLSIVAALLLACSWNVFYTLWLRPLKLAAYLKDQGLAGLPYRLLHGNLKEDAEMVKEALSEPMNLSHHIVPRVLPFLDQIVKNHGKMSFTWIGYTPRVIIMEPELIREVFSIKFRDFHRLRPNPPARLLATGLVSYDGEKWTKHRRIINPAFHLQKLKGMLPAFSASCSELISRWENLVGCEGCREVDVWPDLNYFTGEVISRTAFGSNYREGMRIFQLQAEQSKLMIKVLWNAYIPGMRFLPTKDNLRRKKIDKEVCGLLRGMILKREKEMKMGNAPSDDLLSLLIESNIRDAQEQGSPGRIRMTIDDVIKECKLFYFAGQESTSVFLTWTMVALSMHPTWQVRAREEVLQAFGKNKPDFDGLNHLKIVPMILYEVLRLYPSVPMITRRTYKKMRLGEVMLPPGIYLSMPTLLVHHDPDLWGEDAAEFKPERFSEGISKATNNRVSFIPFGWGPRICVGQTFTLIEAKLALCMILQHFSFELSPSYAHAPYTVITIQPQHGAQLILKHI